MLPDGRVLVVGGTDATLTTLTSCELFSGGTWSAAGNLTAALTNHTLVLLPDGRALAAGATAAIYTPVTGASGSWAATGVPPISGTAATVLASGQVLALSGSGSAVFHAAAPAWQGAGVMPAGHSRQSAHLLPNGRVLLAGGTPDNMPGRKSSEFTGATWVAAGEHAVERTDCPTVQLADGRVLIAGSTWTPWTSCEVYDPTGRIWSPTGAMVAVQRGARLTLLADGRVLASGGFVTNGSNQISSVATCSLYNPINGTWSATGSMRTARNDHSATLLADGRVLVVAGQTTVLDLSTVQGSCEVYDPQTGTWSYTGSLATFRFAHTATLLASGRVLVTGGKAGSTVWSSCELFQPASGEWSPTGSLVSARSNHAATLLPSGRVLVSGGELAGLTQTALCEDYDPYGGTWTAAPAMAAARKSHSAILMPDGGVLIAGGTTNSVWYLTSSERYSMPSDGTRRSTVSGLVMSADSVAITGGGFVIAATASGGGGMTSNANIPCAAWRRSGDGRVWWLQPIGGFSPTTATHQLPSDAVGDGWLTVHTSGIASLGTRLNIPLPSVTISASAARIREDATATITVTASRPSAFPIRIVLGTSGTAGGEDYTLAATSLTIAPGTTSATTQVVGIFDTIDEGDETVVVGLTTVTGGTIVGSAVTVTLANYQTPGFTLSRSSGLLTSEAGAGSDSFTLRLSSQPTETVTVQLASTDSTEGVITAGSTLVFTGADWAVARTVEITGVDDAIADGDMAYAVVGSSSSDDSGYNGKAIPTVSLVNDDDDTAGITIAAPVGFITEGGGSATVGVSLASQPTSNVTLAIASGTPAQGTASPSTLSFTTTNWNIPQTVTVTGADGDGADNPTAGTNFSLTTTVTAGPAEYPTSITASRTLTCFPSNAAPTIAAVAAQTVAEDSTGTTVTLGGIGAGGGTESQTLTVTATSSDPAILP
ncbi:MAG TPA: hypothetical protein DCS97_12110, partial [Planctomycetes bacterium]|nr:hypothetical protein [Planctomycetota bacterium]